LKAKETQQTDNNACSLDEIPDINDYKYIKIGLAVIFVMFGILGTWSAFALLDSGVPLNGKVVTQANNKIIQHLEGGIVEKIYVDSGDNVKKGDLLIKLSEAKAKSSLLSIQANYYEALAKESRLQAENQELKDVNFSEELDNLEPQKKAKLIKAQLEIFHNDKNSYAKNKKIAAQKIASLKKQIESLENVIKIKEGLLQSYGDEAQEQRELLKENLTNKVQLRDVERKIEATKSDILSNKTEIEKAKIQISEIETQLALQQEEYFKKIKEDLRKTQTSIADMRARMIELKDRLKRTEIKAPVSGTVLNMQVHTIGAVIAPGKPIMEIVPQDSQLIIEAELPTQFRDYVHVGSKANMTFPAFQMKGRFIHNIEGEVIFVAADSTTEKDGRSFYKVKLIIDKEGQKTLQKENLKIVAGMPASATVKIGKQTTLEYLLKPMSIMLDKAFLEE
jgi:epimerase transport system membrane fusion protein